MSNLKNVIVTGATGALGRAVLADFRAAGLPVTVLGREGSLARLDTASYMLALAVDLLDVEAVRRAIDDSAARLGAVHALVCVAGGYAGGHPVGETPPAVLEQQLALNLLTTYNPVHAAIPHLVASGGGAIAAVSSRPALEAAAGSAAYAIAKLGVIKLMQTVAEEYRDRHIRANVVVPSIIDTPENRAAMPRANADEWVRPEDIARVLRFLISGDAAIISGATIPVYGQS